MHVTDATSATLLQIAYTRDARGRITGVASSEAKEDWDYTYDDLDQLLQATNLNDAALTQSFTYDRVGNMTSNSLIGAYVYPSAGSPRPHTPLSINANTLAYVCQEPGRATAIDDPCIPKAAGSSFLVW